MVTVIVPADLEAQIGTVIGSPFMPCGRTPAAWDCVGTVAWIWGEILGYEPPSLEATYSAAVALKAGRRERAALIASGARAYEACDRRAGAIVRLVRFNVVGHIGVMLDARRFVHTDAPVGTAIGNLDDPACGYGFAGCVVPRGVRLVDGLAA